MKKSGILTLLYGFALSSLGFITASQAADIDAIVEETAAYDWTGFYLGAHIGYGEADVDGTHDNIGEPIIDFPLEWGMEPNGLIGGVHGGFNWQLGSILLGIEGDVSRADWEDQVGPNLDGETASTEVDWLATLRARLGLALDNFLIYGTAGAAWTDAEVTVVDTPTDVGSVEFDDVGLVAGGGVEWGIAENWSWKLEGLWFNFDDKQDTSGLTADSDPGDFVKFDDAWVVSTGIGFRF
jgi:outer membrane immunogenic protein